MRDATALHRASRRADRLSARLYRRAFASRRAARARARIDATVALLLEHPFAGRETSHPQVRRIVVTPYHYLLDYRATAAELVVLRFRHAARAPVA